MISELNYTYWKSSDTLTDNIVDWCIENTVVYKNRYNIQLGDTVFYNVTLFLEPEQETFFKLKFSKHQ